MLAVGIDLPLLRGRAEPAGHVLDRLLAHREAAMCDRRDRREQIARRRVGRQAGNVPHWLSVGRQEVGLMQECCASNQSVAMSVPVKRPIRAKAELTLSSRSTRSS